VHHERIGPSATTSRLLIFALGRSAVSLVRLKRGAEPDSATRGGHSSCGARHQGEPKLHRSARQATLAASAGSQPSDNADPTSTRVEAVVACNLRCFKNDATRTTSHAYLMSRLGGLSAWSVRVIVQRTDRDHDSAIVAERIARLPASAEPKSSHRSPSRTRWQILAAIQTVDPTAASTSSSVRSRLPLVHLSSSRR